MLGALLLAATFSTMKQVPTSAPALQPNPSVTQFTFVVAGDNRPDQASDGLTVPLKAIITAAGASPQPALIVWNGDTVYGKKHKGIKDEYDAFLGAFAALPVPLFNAPGNHELATKLDCKEKAEFPSEELLDDYQKSMSAAYGMFRYGNAAFVLVNTDDLLDVDLKNHCDYNGYVSKTQLKALQETLAQLDADASVTHIFLFMHRPIHDDNDHQIGSTKSNAYAKQVEAFRHDVDHGGYKKLLFVFSSHDHRLYVYPNGASLSGTSPGSGGEPTFIVTGGAGAPLSGCKPGKSGNPGAYYHYLSVAVDGGNVKVTPVPLYGTTPCTPPPS